MPTPQEELYREIPLTQGQVTTVDAADYEWLIQWHWHAYFSPINGRFYAKRTGRKGEQATVWMHRAILGLVAGDRRHGDHEDLDGLNNRRRNLRIATRSQNSANTPPRSFSGYKGVYWQKEAGKWQATIFIDGRNKSLGYFDDVKIAHAAYVDAAKSVHREFARCS